jgi:hypothetical protein
VNDTSRFAGGAELQFAKRQRQLALAVRHTAAAVGLGLLLGFLGPFRTGTTLGPAERYAFWLGLALFGYTCVVAARQIVRRPASGTLRLLTVTLVSAVPQTFATAWALSVVQPGRTFGPAHLGALFGPVAIVQLGLALAASRLATPSRPAVPSQPGERPSVPFLDRVPLRLGRQLLTVEAEDHYLRVHTALGSELILARLSDAVAQLEGYDGLQVHRSWWVAADAVAGVIVQNGRLALRLNNGLTIPVSRTYRDAVRERRWPRV